MQTNHHPNLKVLFALTLIHFTGDFYSAFTTPLFPAFMDKLNLSLAQVGLIAGINRFLSFIVQPVAGYLADRHQGRAIILGGLAMTVVFIPLAGIAGGFWPLVIFISLGSVGSSLFHPSVAGMIPLYSGSRKGFKDPRPAAGHPGTIRAFSCKSASCAPRSPDPLNARPAAWPRGGPHTGSSPR